MNDGSLSVNGDGENYVEKDHTAEDHGLLHTVSGKQTWVKVYENESQEIVFELPSTYADFIAALEFPIVPKHILEDTFYL